MRRATGALQERITDGTHERAAMHGNCAAAHVWLDAYLLGNRQGIGVVVVDAEMFERIADLVIVSLKAQSYDQELAEKSVEAMDSHNALDAISYMLGSEAMRGFSFGLATALAIISGADADDELRRFRATVDNAIKTSMVENFRSSVERYSEEGEG